MKKSSIITILLFVNCILTTLAQTITVSSNADAGVNSLRAAIVTAKNNETIVFASSLANQTITLTSTLEIPAGKNITIDGAAASGLAISGNNVVSIFFLNSNVDFPTGIIIKNLILTKAYTRENGAAIRAEHKGKLTIEKCVFTLNNARQGGSAIYGAYDGTCTIKDCKFDNNTSIADNTERGSTVMIFGPGASSVQRCDFTNNKGINGAAINGLNSGLLIEDCNFIKNVTSDAKFDTGKENDFLRGFGGAIYLDRATSGPPSTALGSFVARRCKFEGNIGQSDGGAMYLYTDETDNVLIEDCYFNDNHAKLLSNQYGGGGGAIEQMNNSKNKGFVVKNCTFSNNSAAVNGGAIRADWADTQISNCTFYNNKALQTKTDGYSANGGALVCFSMDKSSVDITNCTFANNYAGWVGGAITSDKVNTKIKNSIFFQNTAGNGTNNWKIQQHTSDEFVDLGNNIQFPAKFTNNFNDFNVSNVVKIIDPKLGAISDNGGISLTIPLLAGSPAINAGSGCSTLDQRGAPRAGNCDIGAIEFNSVVTSNDENIIGINAWKIFPNPVSASDYVVISKPENDIDNPCKVTVTDLHGKTFSQDYIDSKNGIHLSTATLPNGIYTISIENCTSKYQTKLIKLK